MKRLISSIYLLLAAFLSQAQTISDASFIANLWPEQTMELNALGAKYYVKSTTAADGTSLSNDMADIESHITTLNIDASAIPGTVSRISIYANSQTAIAGRLTWDGSSSKVTMGTSAIINAYASNTNKSDVITVTGSDTSCKAFLFPVELVGGVTVVVNTEDGKFYSQNFSDDIAAGETKNLTITNTTPTGAWMASIPGNTQFTYLTLPGSHDSATKGCSANTTECQSLSIAEQLRAGVRSIDLRPYATSSTTADDMYIYHGIMKTSYLFKDALAEIVTYLKENPTETVFVLLHEEDGNNLDAWRSAVMSCLTYVKDYIKVIDSNMTLDKCRGKMVIIARDNVGNTALCGKCGWGSSFNDKTVYKGCDTNGSTSWILTYQDEYDDNDYTTNRISNMEKLQSNYIVKNKTDKNRIYFNSSNVSWSFWSSSRNIQTSAPIVNQSILNSSVFQNSVDRWGIISADYIGDANYYGDKLLQFIINHNYQYLYKNRSASTIDPTDIKSPDAEKSFDSSIYDLNGHRIKSMHRGINIVGGTKVLVK